MPRSTRTLLASARVIPTTEGTGVTPLRTKKLNDR